MSASLCILCSTDQSPPHSHPPAQQHSLNKMKSSHLLSPIHQRPSTASPFHYHMQSPTNQSSSQHWTLEEVQRAEEEEDGDDRTRTKKRWGAHVATATDRERGRGAQRTDRQRQQQQTWTHGTGQKRVAHRTVRQREKRAKGKESGTRAGGERGREGRGKTKEKERKGEETRERESIDSTAGQGGGEEAARGGG